MIFSFVFNLSFWFHLIHFVSWEVLPNFEFTVFLFCFLLLHNLFDCSFEYTCNLSVISNVLLIFFLFYHCGHYFAFMHIACLQPKWRVCRGGIPIAGTFGIFSRNCKIIQYDLHQGLACSSFAFRMFVISLFL